MKNSYKKYFDYKHTHPNGMKIKKIHGINIDSHYYYIIHDQCSVSAWHPQNLKYYYSSLYLPGRLHHICMY